MTDSVRLTSHDAPQINTARFQEDVEAALGFPVMLYVQHEGGVLAYADLARADGLPLTAEQVATVMALARAHDPRALSAGQAADQERQAGVAASSRALTLFDPAGIADAVAKAETFEALRDLAAQMAALIMHLVVLIRAPGS